MGWLGNSYVLDRVVVIFVIEEVGVLCVCCVGFLV